MTKSFNILDEIVAGKKIEVHDRQRNQPLSDLKSIAREKPVRDFFQALAAHDFGVIAEVKLRSPSRGDIMPLADPVVIAKEYKMSGAAAVSVLTDGKYFGGSLQHLRCVSSEVDIPVLRKDFIISEYQVVESKAAGADAILLIADILEPAKLRELYGLAREYGLAVLVEFHGKQHLKQIIELRPRMVGINSRDLQTMKTDLDRNIQLIDTLPPGSIKVAESGIHSVADLQKVADAGFNAALMGIVLMESGNPGKKLAELLKGLVQ